MKYKVIYNMLSNNVTSYHATVKGLGGAIDDTVECNSGVDLRHGV